VKHGPVIGILAHSTFRPTAERIREFTNVAWGTDSVIDAVARIARSEVACILIEAQVEFLSANVLAAARTAGVAIAVFDALGTCADWLEPEPGLSIVTSVDDCRSVFAREISSESSAATPMIVAVWGPPGSPGVTSTAISVAALAALDKRRVMLCDADTRGASVSLALGLLDDVPGFAAASRLAGRNELTAVEIKRLALPADRGKARFSVLTGLPRSSRWSEIEPAKSVAVLDLLCSQFDVIVVDVGSSIEENEWIDNAPQRDGAAREILRRADFALAVGTPDTLGIARLIRGLDDLREIRDDPLVVLNQTTRSTATEARSAMERFTSHTVSASVQRDGRRGIEDALARANTFAPVWSALKTTEVAASVP